MSRSVTAVKTEYIVIYCRPLQHSARYTVVTKLFFMQQLQHVRKIQ